MFLGYDFQKSLNRSTVLKMSSNFITDLDNKQTQNLTQTNTKTCLTQQSTLAFTRACTLTFCFSFLHTILSSTSLFSFNFSIRIGFAYLSILHEDKTVFSAPWVQTLLNSYVSKLLCSGGKINTKQQHTCKSQCERYKEQQWYHH